MPCDRSMPLSEVEVGAPDQNGYAKRLPRAINVETVDVAAVGHVATAHEHLGRFLDDI